MVKYLPEGPKYYPDDMITDVQERFVVAEIVREKALKKFKPRSASWYCCRCYTNETR